MKRFVCLLVILMFALPSMAFALTNETKEVIAFCGLDTADSAYRSCSHEWREMPGVVRACWVSISDTLHEYREYHESVCDNCGDIVETFKASNLESHTMVMSDGGHIAGRNQHRYNALCKCGKQETTVIGCNGTGNGDCPLPYSLRQ